MLKAQTLSNGLKYASYHLPNLKSVYISALVKGGSILDKPKTAGMAHFMEHILMEGIPSFPSSAILGAYLESMAARYNAQTSIWTIKVWFHLPESKFEEGLKVLSETIFTPLFLEQAIEKERSAIIHEIKTDKDSEGYRFGEFYTKIRYKKSSLINVPTVGEVETVSNLTRDDLVNFWKENFVPKNINLTAVGNLPGNLTELITKYFGSYSPGKAVKFPDIGNSDFADNRLGIDHIAEFKVNKLSLSFLTDININCSRGLSNRLVVANRILYGSLTSRLFKKLRVESGLVYDVGGTHRYYTTGGLMDIRSQVTNENLKQVLEIIVQELKNFLTDGPTEEEVIQAVNYKINGAMMRFDSPGGVADWIEGELLWEDKIQLPEEYAEDMKTITRDSIHQFVKEHWNVDKACLVIQGPLENSAENKKALTEILNRL